MATSTLKLYQDCKITIEKNFVVEQLNTYLPTLTSTTIDDFQYIKHDVEIKIKVDMPQSALDGNITSANMINYISITNHDGTTDEKTYYYFVTDKKWLSVNTIEFLLKMDTLNTWSDSYNLTPKTKIKRQHKDRIKQYGHGTSSTFSRIIDRTPEGFSPELAHNDSEDVTIVDQFDTSWNLVYKNRQAPSPSDQNPPVDCYCYPDDAVTLKVHGEIAELTPTDFAVDTYYYFIDGTYDIYNESNNNQHDIVGSVSPQIDIGSSSWVRLFIINNKITVNNFQTFISYKSTPPYYELHSYVTSTTDITKLKLQSNSDVIYHYSNTITADRETAATYPTRTLHKEEFIDKNLSTIKNLDRSDSKIIKIIKLPYFPAVVRNDDGKAIIDAPEWIYNETYNCLQLRDSCVRLNKLDDYSDQVNPFEELLLASVPYTSRTLPRNDTYESKLFNSDFYRPKFVYDSFSIPFQLENLDVDNYKNNPKFDIDYTVTSTMNSRFLFMFPQYKCTRATQDYNNMLIVSRNNEVTIYNSEYLNYIRNGYNYDQKSKVLGIINNVVSTGTSAIRGAVGGSLTGSKTAGLVIGAASGVANTITSAIQAEWNIQEKLQQTQSQAVTTSGSDDLDLLEVYSNNRAKVVTYKCTDNIRTLLADLFYYYGYADEKQGLPSVSSRYWFNYVQCEPVFERTRNIDDKYIDDLIQRYNEGVTYMHHHKIFDVDRWDFTQIYENWETNLY